MTLSISCSQWNECGVFQGGCCGLGLYGGRPGYGACLHACKRFDGDAESRTAALKQLDLISIKGATSVQFPEPASLSTIELRASMCQVCPHLDTNRGGIRRTINGHAVHAVTCKKCGCAGLSLSHGKCPDGRWPEATPIASSIESNKNSSADALAMTGPRHLVIGNHQSPGDVLMLTAALRDLHRANPGRFVTDIESSCGDLWDNNPHVTRFDRKDVTFEKIDCGYPIINQSNQRPYHFIHGFAQHLEEKLGVRIPVTEFRGDIHLSPDEMRWANQVAQDTGFKGAFWIMMAGGKYDFTAKWWNPESYQAVVDHFRGRVQFVQCGDAKHWHPALKGVINMVGKTSLRQFVRLMYHAQGVVCPVTFAMHLAAAVPTKDKRLRPCVVIAGGREPPHWEAYPGHQFLHTIGALPCCATGGCWKSRCQKVGDGDKKDKEGLCERPIQIGSDLRIPQCMAMVEPHHVIEAIERYLAYSYQG